MHFSLAAAAGLDKRAGLPSRGFAMPPPGAVDSRLRFHLTTPVHVTAEESIRVHLRRQGIPLPALSRTVQRRSAGPHMAVQTHHTGPRLVRGGPARRQPGTGGPHVARTQTAHVRAVGGHGLQGDRSRISRSQPSRLRLRAFTHRDRRHPRRRHGSSPGPVPGAPHRPDVRISAGCQTRHRALLQFDVDTATSGRVRDGSRRHHRHRHARRETVPEVRRDPHARHRRPVRVLTGVLHRNRTRLRRLRVFGRHRRHRPHSGEPAHRQPAVHCRDGHAERVRRLDRMDAPCAAAPRQCHPVGTPPQRPWNGRRRRRARCHGGRRPCGGVPVRQR